MADSVEKQIKDLEQRLSNAEIRHKRLEAEVQKSMQGLLKSIGKHQAEAYQMFRLELTQKAAEERKKTDAAQKLASDKLASEQKALKKQFEVAQKDLKKLLR